MADLSAQLYGNPQGLPPVSLTGDEYLKTLPPQLGSLVKEYASGKLPISPMMVRTPAGMQLMSAISQYDPTFDSTNFTARNKLRSDFTSGKASQNLNAFNTVLGHLGELHDSYDNLHNGSIPVINTVGNWIADAAGKPAPNTFNLNKKAVVDELTRSWRGSSGSQGDIASWTSVLDNAQSPEQFNSAMKKVTGLLKSKIDAMQDQYNTGMGSAAKVGAPQWINPNAQKELDRLSGNGDQAVKTGQPDLAALAAAELAKRNKGKSNGI